MYGLFRSQNRLGSQIQQNNLYIIILYIYIYILYNLTYNYN